MEKLAKKVHRHPMTPGEEVYRRENNDQCILDVVLHSQVGAQPATIEEAWEWKGIRSHLTLTNDQKDKESYSFSLAL